MTSRVQTAAPLPPGHEHGRGPERAAKGCSFAGDEALEEQMQCHRAACKIQAVVRGRRGRRAAVSARNERRHKAAVRIQLSWRCYLAWREFSKRYAAHRARV